jgi:hypothetical protein
MPNYCDNSLNLYNADKSKIDEVEKVLNDTLPLFEHLRPCGEGDNWYDDHINKWGTKWDAGIIDFERIDDNEIYISFESAWCPPIALYDYLSENDWKISAYYNEPGVGFCGKYADSLDECYEYNMADLESLELIPEDINDFTGNIDWHYHMKEDGEFDEEQS